MFNEEDKDDDGLGVFRGLANAFIIMILIFMIIGTIYGVK